ncbi:MAG: glycosyltransferase family 2 protein [Bacteroides sp.]
MHLKLSIIIPAYNAEKHIERCIHSLYEQDMATNEYEVLVINDGSTDQTLAVVERLCKQYPFVRLFSTINNGLSISRNKGIKASAGEYLLFLDADDCFRPHCLKTIYQEMSQNKLDMMLMNYRYLLPDGTDGKTGYHLEKNTERIVSGREFLLRNHYAPMIPLYAYRHSFLIERSLAFLPIGHEDEAFTPCAICQAQRIKYFPLTFYNYYQNSESFMNNYNEKNFQDMIAAMHSIHLFKQKQEKDIEVATYLDSLIANRLIMIFKRSMRDGYNNQKELVCQMKEAGLYPLKPKHPSFYTLLFNFSPTLFEAYYRLIKRK